MITPKLTYQRCYNHAEREAAARCPECGRFFCRECVSEHDDRVLCAKCLAKLLKPSVVKRYHLGGIMKAAQAFVSIVILWLFFYVVGQMLLTIPTAFHEETLWQNSVDQNE